MRLPFGLELRSSIEQPGVRVSQTKEFFAFFGLDSARLPRVTVDSALTVPAVAAAVGFLSRTMASLPLHGFQKKDGDKKPAADGIDDIIDEAWNDEVDAYEGRLYFWTGVFTSGRGLAWIERDGPRVVNLWPMVPSKTTITRVGNAKVYRYEGKDYPARDVIDVPFLLKPDQLAHYGPINLAAKAIQLALAMNSYAANYFAGGGVPPLAMTGPLPKGADGINRAMTDVWAAIDAAKASDKPIFPMPPGHDLKPVGIDPSKSQMEEARLFQIQEIARVWQTPPAFLQDLSHGTMSNVEQQDLNLVKHVISHWAKALESEMTLKFYGRGKERAGRFVEHNLDGLMRGDFKSRTEGIARAIQTAQLTPNEARVMDNRPRHTNPAADELLVQGATVPLGQQPVLPTPTTKSKDEGDNADT